MAYGRKKNGSSLALTKLFSKYQKKTKNNPHFFASGAANG
jgi:hypothetical protein